MRDVKLVRLSEDGTHLVLAHESTGEEFALRIDDRVRGAVVSDRARVGQLPMERPSRLRPKEIQARLRAGESSEDIASAADVPLERILRYAGPVLAERAYVSEQARRCVLRRAGGEGAGKPLEDLVGQRLTAFGSDPDKADWDAWRAPDGRWAVSVTYNLDGEDQRAVFSFDPLGRVVLPSDDAAHAIIEGPKVDGPAPRTPRDRLRLAPSPAEPQVEPFVDSVGPERTERQADVRPLRPATTLASRVREEAGTPDDIGVDRDVDSEDTIDLSRALDRREPISAPDELADLDDGPVSEQVPEHVPEPVYEPEPAPAPVPEAPKPAPPKPTPPKPVPAKPAPPREARPIETEPIETEPAETAEPEPIQPELTPAEPVPAPAARTQPEPAAEPEAEPELEEEPAKPVRRQRPADAAARKRRASRSSRKGSVPSWDDILFGNSRGKD